LKLIKELKKEGILILLCYAAEDEKKEVILIVNCSEKLFGGHYQQLWRERMSQHVSSLIIFALDTVKRRYMLLRYSEKLQIGVFV
jgi:hypothetical protein